MARARERTPESLEFFVGVAAGNLRDGGQGGGAYRVGFVDHGGRPWTMVKGGPETGIKRAQIMRAVTRADVRTSSRERREHR